MGLMPYRWARFEDGAVLYSSMGPMPKVFAIRIVSETRLVLEAVEAKAGGG